MDQAKDQNHKAEMESLLSSWMKASGDFWESAAKLWPGMTGLDAKSSPGEKEENREAHFQAFWEPLNEVWRAYTALLKNSGSSSSDAGRTNSIFPGFIFQAMQPFWSGYIAIQEQLMKGMEKAGGFEGFTSMARHTNRAMSEMCEKEFKQILNIPQLGMTRFYQERVSTAVEKFGDFQNSLTEYLNILCGPLEEAFKSMREKTKDMTLQGEEALKDSKALYQEWMKDLEGKYLSLLRSKEYNEAMRSTLKALKDYRIAKQQLMVNVLQDLPIPTNNDMDELYKEIYTLKKRVRELEKKRGKSHEK